MSDTTGISWCDFEGLPGTCAFVSQVIGTPTLWVINGVHTAQASAQTGSTACVTSTLDSIVADIDVKSQLHVGATDAQLCPTPPMTDFNGSSIASADIGGVTQHVTIYFSVDFDRVLMTGVTSLNLTGTVPGPGINTQHRAVGGWTLNRGTTTVASFAFDHEQPANEVEPVFVLLEAGDYTLRMDMDYQHSADTTASRCNSPFLATMNYRDHLNLITFFQRLP